MTTTTEKPTTISAREFVEQGYAEKVKRGECEAFYMTCSIDSVYLVKDTDGEMKYQVRYHYNDKLMAISLEVEPQILAIHWLTTPQPASPQPASATAEGSGAMPKAGPVVTYNEILTCKHQNCEYYLDSGLFQCKECGCVFEFGYLLKQYQNTQAQLAEAQKTIKHQGEVYAQEIVDHQMTSKRLATADDTVRGLRNLAGRAADAIDLVGYADPAKIRATQDDLRQAAKVGDEWATKQPIPATAEGSGADDGAIQARALDHVSTQWVQLHQLISEALGLEFLPNEDIERYSEAITALRNQLQAAEDTVRGLRSLAGRAADVLKSVGLPFSYVVEFIDDLRRAAGGEK